MSKCTSGFKTLLKPQIKINNDAMKLNAQVNLTVTTDFIILVLEVSNYRIFRIHTYT